MTDVFHKHKCKFCGLVWEHHNVNDVRHGDEGAHECPGCHRCNWGLGIYQGDEAPRARNGRTPAPTAVPGDRVTIHPDQDHVTRFD